MRVTLTKALKAHAVKTFGVKADAADETFHRVIGLKVASGKFPAKELAKLATVKRPAPDDDDQPPAPKKPVKRAGFRPADIEAIVAKQVKDALKANRPDQSDITPEDLFGKAGRIRVKGVAEKYSTSTKGAYYPANMRKDGRGQPHPLAGQPAKCGKVSLDHPSDLVKAVSAAWVKWNLHHQMGGRGLPQNLRLTEDDKNLVLHAAHSMEWSGVINTAGGAVKAYRRKLVDFERKSILDDTISGGIEAAPSVFDDAIILFPVLYGELFPFVSVTNLTRGRRVKGASMQRPDFTSGPAEGTAITPFNTASFIQAFDTTIHTATGAMEIGLDFEEDTPVDIGGTMLEQWGEQALVWLDRVVAIGNGYNEPLGILNTTGLVAIPTDNGTPGPPTVSDYESLYFGIGKAYRNEPGAVLAYVGNDTSYRRSRGIQVGSDDQRRVFGMNPDEYSILGKPFKVQNGIPNSKIAFANLKRYRMYRRLGLTIKVTDQGRSLALSNTRLMVLRMRFGGQMETANAVAYSPDAQE